MGKIFQKLIGLQVRMRSGFLDKVLSIKVFLICDLLVLVAKMGLSLLGYFPQPHFEDWDIANQVANYGSYQLSIGFPTAYKLPVYPLFLSIFIFLFHENALNVVVLVQHIFYFFIPLLIIKTLRIFNKQKAGILAGYLFLLSPAYFYYSSVIEVTNVFIPIFLIWLYNYFLIYLGKSTAVSQFIIFGLITAILFLTQVVAIPTCLVLVAYGMIKKRFTGVGAALYIVSAILFYSPWVIRNYLEFDKVIISKSPFWQNIYHGFSEEAIIFKNIVPINEPAALNSRTHNKVYDEFEKEKLYKEEVIKYVKDNNSVVMLKGLQNAFILWYVPPKYFDNNGYFVLFGRKLYVIFLNILTLFSLIYFFRKDRRLFYLSILIFVGFTFPYVIGHATNMRFKLDFEWYQLVLVAIFLTEKITETGKKQSFLS